MHADTGDGIHAVVLGNAFDGGGDVFVLRTGFDSVSGDEHAVVGCNGDVAHFVVDGGWGFWGIRDDYGVCCDGDVAVDVAAEIDFYHIP